jgi:hypothetical protein
VAVIFQMPLQKFVELVEGSNVMVVQPSVLELLDGVFGHGVGEVNIGLAY